MTLKHGIMFDDISTLVAKLNNYVRREGSTSSRLQASIVAVDPSMPKHEISPRGNDASHASDLFYCWFTMDCVYPLRRLMR
jgi:hypothetical protein